MDRKPKLSRKMYIQAFALVFVIFVVIYLLALNHFLSADEGKAIKPSHLRLGEALVIAPILMAIGVILFLRDMRRYK